MTEEQVRKSLSRAIGTMSQLAWAKQNGVNETVLSEVLRSHRPPTARMCELIGIHKRIVSTTKYERMK